MTKRLVLTVSLAALSLGSHAATIENVISPTSVVLTHAGARSVASFDGKPVFYCGLKAFESWAAPLVGQPVGSNLRLTRFDGRICSWV